MGTTQHKPYRRYGLPVWRTVIKASDVTLRDLARAADTEYDTVVKMSHGHVRTSPSVWRALSDLTGHSVSDLQEAVAIRMELIAEDGERS